MAFLSKSCKSNGFTLFEVLLVLALIAIFVSLVSIPNVGRSAQEQIEQEAQRFATLINLSSEYSVLNNKVLGVMIEPEQYEFLIFDGANWRAINEKPLQKRRLPEFVLIKLELDGLAWAEDNLVNSVSWKKDETEQLLVQEDEQNKKKFPQIFILPSGEISAFEVEFDYDSIDEITDPLIVRGVFSTPVDFGRRDELEDVR